MSGIAGIWNRNGAPADRDLLEHMAASLAYRGPDAAGVWQRGSVGLAHTLASTSAEPARERQPATLDGSAWIVADARIDGREELIAALRAQGRSCPADAADAELLLHAYAAWGERCVERLLGDFAFALWDSRERRLYCARDHFGVRPLFYAEAPGAFLFASAMDTLRLHPDVASDFYEPAIADYLILGFRQEVDRTVLASIRRLAPAHLLLADERGVRTRRYWSLPVDPPARLKRREECRERFGELFRQAVAERLRANRAAVLMSGGLDSTAVAATARQVLLERGVEVGLSAHTHVYDRLIPDSEGPYARRAAEALGMTWHRFPLDDFKLLENWDRPEFRRAEPELLLVFSWKYGDMLASDPDKRIVLTGLGGDPAFASLRGRHCRERLRQGRWLQLVADVGRYLSADGRVRRLNLRTHLPKALWPKPYRHAPDRRPYPDWIHPDLEKRLALRDRYESQRERYLAHAAPEGAVRPEAHALLASQVWPSLFPDYDPVTTGTAAEFCHPFFDLRLLRFLLSLPALPWCSDKQLLRDSMKGFLPDDIRLRPKTGLPGDYLAAHFRKSPQPWLQVVREQPLEELRQYVVMEKVWPHLEAPRDWELIVHVRPIYLNYWMRSEKLFQGRIQQEGRHAEVHSSVRAS